MSKTYYFDMDGVLADYHGYVNGNWALGRRRETFTHLPAFVHNVAVLNALLKAGVTCYILSKAANESVADGKREWLARYVPMMDEAHIIIITRGRKVDYIREAGILIDDDETNCKQWRKGGYEALHLATKGAEISL